MRPSRTTLLAALVSLSVTLAVLPAGATGTQTDSETLTVDQDSTADYQLIQAAVAAADSGDTVEVRPGTYREQVTINDSSTLVAPDRAILDGSRFTNGTAITVTDTAEADVSGFTVRNYRFGLAANGTSSDWTIRDSRFVEVGGDGVDARRTTGYWELSSVIVDRTGADGVDASGTTGDWTVTGLTVQQSDTGLVTAASSGAWTLTDATLETSDIGVFTARTTGAWAIQNTTIESTQQGIHAVKTNASWTVSESTVTVTASQNAIGIDTRSASDDWSLTDVTIDSSGVDVAE